LVNSFRFRKLRRHATNYLSLQSVSPNCTSKEGHELTHISAGSGTLHVDQRTCYCWLPQ